MLGASSRALHDDGRHKDTAAQRPAPVPVPVTHRRRVQCAADCEAVDVVVPVRGFLDQLLARALARFTRERHAVGALCALCVDV